MAGDQDRDPPFTVQLQDQLTDLHDPLGIQSVDRFIQDKEIRISGKGNGNAQPLLHAHGKVLYLFLSSVLKSHQLQQPGDPIIRRQPQNKILLFQILFRRHIHINSRCLHHGSHAPAGPGHVPAAALDAVKSKIAGRRLLQSADQTDQRGLACPVLSHKAIDRAFGNIHRKAVQRLEIFIFFCQAVGLQNIAHTFYLL